MASVVFIGSPSNTSTKEHQQFIVSLNELLFRIFASFIPPFRQKYRKVYVDMAGPLLGLIILTSFLIYGYSLKKHEIGLGVSPIEVMLAFAICMPCFCFVLAKLGRSSISFYETISLVGYSLYGHLLTLLFSFIFFQETSNTIFFAFLVVFGGSSSLRLILVFLRTIVVPGARLLVCSAICLVNVLFMIFLYFGFMHRTFH